MFELERFLPRWMWAVFACVLATVTIANQVVDAIADARTTQSERILIFFGSMIVVALVVATVGIAIFGTRWAIATLRTARANPRREGAGLRHTNLLRAAFLTLAAIMVLMVHTFILNEFFRSIIAVRLYILGNPVALSLVVSLLYSALLVAVGMMLEVQNSAGERSLGSRVMKAILILYLVVVAIVDVGCFAILSFSLDWPWRDFDNPNVPLWFDGWLGVLGIVLVASIATVGYQMSAGWSAVLRGRRDTTQLPTTG